MRIVRSVSLVGTLSLGVLAGCGSSDSDGLAQTSNVPTGLGGASGAGGSESGVSGASGQPGASGNAGSTASVGAGGGGGAPFATGGASSMGGASGGVGGFAGSASSGAAGAPLACAQLIVDGPELDVSIAASTPVRNGSRPRLVANGDGTVAVVFESSASGPNPPSSSDIVRASFAPWGTWPSEIDAAATLTEVGGDSFVVSTAPSTGFSLLLSTQMVDGPEFQGLLLLSPITPSGMNFGGFLLTNSPDVPVFLSQIEGGFVVGSTYPSGDKDWQLGVGVTAGNATTLGSVPLSCATASLVASATPSGDSALIAFSNSRDFGTCQLDSGVDGPPSRLQTAILGADGVLMKGSDTTLSAPILTLSSAARSDGAWLAWDLDYSNALVAGPLTAARSDANGVLSSNVVAITQTAEYEGPIAIATLNDRLLFAYQPSLQDEPTGVRVELIDDTGVIASGSLLPKSLVASADMSVLGSPDGTHVLVAWSDFQPGGVHVGRFVCAP